ncbi:MAG: acetate kinase [Bacteroidales bacterium]|jgi:acetate kinase|nr:acetate kinase [Bacteroidales bacterium]
MKILVLNCGSSSIKYKFLNLDTVETLASGAMEKVGMKGSFLKHEKADGEKITLEGEVLDHQVGIEFILGVLLSEKHGCLKTLSDIDAVGHRVVHGGEEFKGSVLIDAAVIAQMEKCIDLAPLHNPPNLKGIYAIGALIPNTPQVGVFDTAFHQTMPDYAYMYGIPKSLYNKYKVRRYGFHGTSHRFVSEHVCDFLGLDYSKTKVINCHLGNGASICAIDGGKSIDTSMGFTPVEGLLMGTRAGDLDIGAVTYIMEKEKISAATANTLFNKHSGLLGVSGVSSDLRDIEEAALNQGHEDALLALTIFRYRIKKYIGAYIAAMGGCDVLTFTGGIGENSIIEREALCKDMDFLGIDLDITKNNVRAKDALISTQDSRIKICVIPTDEELMIADETFRLIK